MVFQGITNSEFAEVLLHIELAGSGHTMSKQNIRDSGKGGTTPLKLQESFVIWKNVDYF